MMKKIIFLPVFLLFLHSAFAQLEPGKYHFSDDQRSLSLSVEEYMGDVKAVFTAADKSVLETTLVFREQQGIQWYESNENDQWDMEVPMDGKVKIKVPGSKYFHLKAAQSVANSVNGVYKNYGAGILVIADYQEGKSFSYKFTYGGDDDCTGLEMSGTATLFNKQQAKDDQIQFTIKDNKIIFEPEFEMLGMDCARLFDTEFTKQ